MKVLHVGWPSFRRSRLSLIGYRAVSDAVSRALYFAVLIVAARSLTAQAFGVVALATTVGWLGGVLSDFGLQLHVAREIARRPAEAAALAWPLLRLRLGLGAAASMVGAAFGTWFLPAAESPAFVTIVLAQLLLSVTEFFYHVYRGLSRSDLESTMAVGHRLGMFSLASVVLWRAPSLAAFALSLLVPAALLLAVAWRAAVRLIPPSPRSKAPRWAPAVPTLRVMWPLGLGLALSALYFRIDVLFVGYFGGTASAGHYGAVFRLVDAIRLIPAAALAVTFPSLCVATTVAPLTRLAVVLGAVGASVALMTAAGANAIVWTAYGEGYQAAIPVLRVLSLAVPLFFINYALTHQLVAWDAQRAYAMLCGGALVVNLVGNAGLVPRLGATGAAWTTVATEVFVTVACVVGIRLTHTARLDRSGWQAAS